LLFVVSSRTCIVITSLRRVEEAFGSTAGLFKGYLSWCSGVLDNSVYPALFYTYLVTVHKLVVVDPTLYDDDVTTNTTEMAAENDEVDRYYRRALDGDDDSDINDEGGFTQFHRTVFIISVTVILACTNYRGLAFAGNVCVAICIFSLTPFVIMIVLGSFQIHPKRWFVGSDMPLSSIDWPHFLNVSV
jgi:amino acid transporter